MTDDIIEEMAALGFALAAGGRSEDDEGTLRVGPFERTGYSGSRQIAVVVTYGPSDTVKDRCAAAAAAWGQHNP